MMNFYEINKKMQCDSNAFHKFTNSVLINSWTVVSYLLSKWIEWPQLRWLKLSFQPGHRIFMFPTKGET